MMNTMSDYISWMIVGVVFGIVLREITQVVYYLVYGYFENRSYRKRFDAFRERQRIRSERISIAIMNDDIEQCSSLQDQSLNDSI